MHFWLLSKDNVLAAAALFGGGKFYSTVIADVDSIVLSIEKHSMHRLCWENPELLWNVARVLAQHKVRSFADMIEALALRNADQRIAEYLVTLAREKGAL